MSNIESTTAKTTDAPFFVGVTGYMDLVPEEVEPLKERLRQLFHFLRHGATRKTLGKLVTDLVPDVKDKKLQSKYRAALSGWSSLGTKTPIVVLTNLSPGVDTLVANLVLDQFAGDNFHLLCPLPFPADVYCGASTFVRAKDGQPDAGNMDRQKDFLRLLVKMSAITPDLVDKANGTADLPPELVKALHEKLPEEQFFAVRLKADIKRNDKAKQQEEDIKPDANALEPDWLADRGDSERRNLRYYAAGEFLTVSAHLLVAVWNGDRETSRSGTSSVVEARLSGPRSGLLPTSPDFPLQHGGPIWHLLANRPNTTAASLESGAETEDAPRPPLRILYPYAVAGRDCPESNIIGAGQAKNIELQTERLRLLARIGENLSNFNSKVVPEKNNRDAAFQKALTEPAQSEPDLAKVLKRELPQFYEGLQHVSDSRCRSSDLTHFYQRRVKRTLVGLFWLTLLAAISLHFCSHWHPRHTKENAANHDKKEDEGPHPTGHDPGKELNPVQIRFGWSSLVLAAAAVGYFAAQRSRKLEPHGHDTRAIAEGLRVQFFWNLAGLGKSVSANYMSRHRSELDWIRGVIRATSTPYDRWKKWFAELDRHVQLRAFRVVQSEWVRSQLSYFRSAGHREHHALHVWHKFGGVAAQAGVLTFLKLVSQESWKSIAPFIERACNGWIALVLVIAAGCWSWYLAHRAAIRQGASNGHGPSGLFPELTKSVAGASSAASKAWSWRKSSGPVWLPLRAIFWFARWVRAVPRIALEFVSVLVPTHRDSALTQTTFARRILHGTWTFLAHLPLALVAACAVSGLCHLIADTFPKSPWPLTLGIIAGGVLLLVGALSVAWAEKNLHSEWAYQYSTMTGLFEAADAQLEEELTNLLAAIDKGDEDTQKQSIKCVQAILFELGQEALDENAEWLILHRARPLEPVMAG